MIKFNFQNNLITMVLLLAIVAVNTGVSTGLITNAFAGLTNAHVFGLAILEASAIAWIALPLWHKKTEE